MILGTRGAVVCMLKRQQQADKQAAQVTAVYWQALAGVRVLQASCTGNSSVQLGGLLTRCCAGGTSIAGPS
jgi:hypothetical protein